MDRLTTALICAIQVNTDVITESMFVLCMILISSFKTGEKRTIWQKCSSVPYRI